MSVVITEKNQKKVFLNQTTLEKAQNLLGAKTESETLELALEIVITKFGAKPVNSSSKNLPDEFFEDLFSEETNLSDGESIQAVVNEREESIF